MTSRVMLLLAVLLAGCSHQVRTVQVRVSVPVECRETEPVRPVMPTEQLDVAAGLDAQIQAMTAEIERREGYELVLVAALRACTSPLEPTSRD